jgi:class 3 adenylate cyclase
MTTYLQCTHTALRGLKTTYAVVDTTNHIVEYGDWLTEWLGGKEDALIGQSLFDLLPEFVGQEDELESVRRGETEFWQLENINRGTAEGDLCYLTLTVVPCAAEMLAILVTDTTKQGKYVQELMQNRNELHLARRQLIELRDRMDTLLRSYLSPEITDALLKGDVQPELGGRQHVLSVLFADVRGFTTLSEKLPPEQMVVLLNDYMNVVAERIEQNNGIIIQFQGDNVITVFNMFNDQPDHASQSVRAGVSIQQGLAAYRASRPPDEPRVHFGVGINTGTALVGNIGARRRYSYNLVGDSVNLAARLEGLTRIYGASVVVSEHTLFNVDRPNQYHFRFLDKVKVKGKGDPVSVFEILDGEPAEVIRLKLRTRTDFEKGLLYYHSEEFAESLEYFNSVLQENPTDRAAMLYLQRASHFMIHGAPPDWSGIEVLTQK